MAYEEWGPLAGLVGDWASDYDGRDVSYHSDAGVLAETEYREEATFAPFGPVGSGPRSLYGLDYRTAIFRRDEDRPFHTEVGYWMWDGAESQVMRLVVISRAQCTLAGGTAEPGATTLRLAATRGSNTYGILANPIQDRTAHATRFDLTVVIDGDTLSYDQTTTIEDTRTPSMVLHTDRNVLRRAVAV